jgi:hypothetical protein
MSSAWNMSSGLLAQVIDLILYRVLRPPSFSSRKKSPSRIATGLHPLNVIR